MATPEEFARGLVSLIHGVAKQVDEAPTGVEPGFHPALGAAVLPNGKIRHVPGVGPGQLMFMAYLGSAAGTTLAATGALRLNYDDIQYDPEGAITTGTWYATLPADGIYRVEMAINVLPDGANFTAGDLLRLRRYVDSVSQHVIGTQYDVPAALVSENLQLCGTQTFVGAAGDKFNTRLQTTMASGAHSIDIGEFADDSYIAMWRIT